MRDSFLDPSVDSFQDLLIRDVECPHCLGHAVLIWPKTKMKTFWPTICLYCNDIGFINTGGDNSHDPTPRSSEWRDTMLLFMLYHIENEDMWSDLAKRLEEIDAR